MRKLLLLRPEPGQSASAGRARALGLEVISCPLFRVEPLEWIPPDPANYDALLLTSANALRHGGRDLGAFKGLPVHAVGSATAAAARGAGFRVETVGEGDVAELLASLPARLRLLHLAGEHRRVTATGHRIDSLIVYRSAQIEASTLPPLKGLVAAVYSPRSGKWLAELADGRSNTIIAAISPAAAEACGEGWERVEVAEHPTDSSLLALAAALCHTPSPA